MQRSLERLIALGIETLDNVRTRSEAIKTVIAARVDVQFGRHSSRQKTARVVDILVQEQVQIADRNVGRRQA